MRIMTGSLRGRILKTIEGDGYRPATGKVREALFSMLTSRGIVWNQTYILDLFAGSGSLGFEAISRGAAEVCFIENNPNAVQCLYKNIEKLRLFDQVSVVEQDVIQFLNQDSLFKLYQLVFIDPPYGGNRLETTISCVVEKGWIAPESYVVAEVETTLRINFFQLHPHLELLSNRSYGQTRLLIWKTQKHV